METDAFKIVVSNDTFNSYAKTGAMVCPITNTDRNRALHVRLDKRTSTTRVVMCVSEQKSLIKASRNAEFIEAAPKDIVFEAIDIVAGILD